MQYRAVLLACALAGAHAFVPASSSASVTASRRVASGTALSMEYIPSGLSKEEWTKIKAKEKAAKTGLGKIGARGFKSRSFDSFQRALEAGEAGHLMPVFDAKGKVARGELKYEDIPYMQRGGNWDNSDVKGAKKKRWLKEDKEYNEKDFQSISIFGGENLPWNTGGRAGAGAKRGVSKPTDAEMWRQAGAVKSIKKAGAKIDVSKVEKQGWFGRFSKN